jgi:uncharacterized membrane protein
MWNRAELKNRAKASLSRCYWKSVFVALVLFISVAGIGAILRWIEHITDAGIGIGSGVTLQYITEGENGSLDRIFRSISIGTYGPVFAAIAIMAGIVTVYGDAIRIAISVFLLGPLEVGSQRWFIVNRAVGDASLAEIVHPFNHSYLNVVKAIFLRWLYLVLWFMLFVIPGIVKTYSYRLVPYILAESPEMETSEAFRLSRAMMDGNKLGTFILDLSFLGWDILSALTFGVVGIFYVTPYRAQTNMELYVTLRDAYLGQHQTNS